MPFMFRIAGPDDVPLIAAIIDAAYAAWIPVLGGRKPRPMLDDHAGRIGRGETWIVERDDLPVGVTSMALNDTGAMHVFNIAVHPDAQGKGVARHVLAFANEQARTAGASRVTLYTNALMRSNRAMYAHLGFTELHEADAPGGYRVVFFERPVTP